MSETSTLISCTGKITRAELVQLRHQQQRTFRSLTLRSSKPWSIRGVIARFPLSRRSSPYLETVWKCSESLIWPPSSTGADPRLESETRTTSDFGWHELSGYESSCVTILRLGEISVLF